MMKLVRYVCVLTLFVGTLAAIAPQGVGAAPSTTRVTLAVKNPNGTPAAGATVKVFYQPFNTPTALGSIEQLPVMATGVTDATGSFVSSLNTAAVQVGDLGDAGDGKQGAFNTLILTTNGDGQVSVDHHVMSYGSANSARARESKKQTMSHRSSGAAASRLSCTIGGICSEVVDSKYRYIRVLALNSAKGMTAKFNYTYDTSTKKQTTVGVAYTYDGTNWSANGSMMEETDRSAKTPWNVSGAYHRYVWANYYWLKYHYWYCTQFSCTDWWEWHANHFGGQVVEDNPNPGPNTSRIGVLTYDTPPFDNNPNHYKVLNANSPSFTRYTGQYKSYGFSLDAAGFLALTDVATYGSVTGVTWAKASGCTGTRYIWGNGTDPVSADIVQASCI